MQLRFEALSQAFAETFTCSVSSRFDVCVVLLPTRFIAVPHVHRVQVSNVACNVEWFYSIWQQILLTIAEQLEENPPALRRFAQRRSPTMNTLSCLAPGSKAGDCRNQWKDAKPLSSAEGATVTALPAERVLEATDQLQAGGKLIGPGKT